MLNYHAVIHSAKKFSVERNGLKVRHVLHEKVIKKFQNKYHVLFCVNTCLIPCYLTHQRELQNLYPMPNRHVRVICDTNLS